ncbi:ribonucleoside-diphosphate reductase subunit alpha [Bacillus sp. AG4(2022)]|uniref:ribonucleoside-diphosphate reductase subunit alpha n=1 Tax=Bacillus sp. AG4(2022) TaxID=2962594 RepID=UPI0037BF69B9
MTVITKDNGRRELPFDEHRLTAFIKTATRDYPQLDVNEYTEAVLDAITSKEKYSAEQITDLLILEAKARIGYRDEENEDSNSPDWTYVASYIYMRSLYKKAASNRAYDSSQKYGDFYGLLKYLGHIGVYSSLILKNYTKEEINEVAKVIDPEKDKLLTYISAYMLATRYLATDYKKNVYELPQERYMIIALHLNVNEDKATRLEKVKDSYWALSNLYMTAATPTLAQAGKRDAQLSSCFIDTVDDSLQGIYDSNTDVANLSKGGGGIGVYIGKIRSKGSTIRGYEGASSGVIPWMKQLNNTAVSVDQLGQRKGAIAVYLDVWHKDIFPFLDAKLNNGDERYRTHDIFTGVCLPDLFMEQVEKRGEWYLFDPKEVRDVMGYSLEDHYDEKEGSGSFRDKYYECVNSNELSKIRVEAIDIMKRIMVSQLETGTPFMFYRDEVNRKNPNKHLGIIYCTNLCTEIVQNQSPTTVKEQREENGMIIIEKTPGDFVVCNLSSISLARAVRDDVLERLLPIQVRMLDNVIDLNNIPVLQAQMSNRKYRAIGLGTFGWHHLLALSGIRWESDTAVDYADKLYEKIAYLTIKASMELGQEKGAYPAFEGSDWHNGNYFTDRGYGVEEDDTDRLVSNKQWRELQKDVSEKGLRNGYLMAVAPNMSTALIGGSTPSIDPIFKKAYSEEKKDYKIPVTVPDLNQRTTWYYKSAYQIDQNWSIKQNAARQRHLDQGISFNIYVKNDVKAKTLLDYHMNAWKQKMKTTYYVRSTSSEFEDCDSCSS